jgi:hypothetical protein
MIKELTYEEAAQLRERVKNRFLQSPFNGAGFKANQYKDSYRHLADDIVRAVPNSEASVTTNRLRKLFYYTDPAICAADKLEKPSFGDDFVQALFKYIEQRQTPITVAPKPPQFPRIWLWRAGILLPILAIFVVTWQWVDRPKYWVENFDDVSVDSLKSRGWEILDYDSVAFSKQLRPGHLTLYTLRGDYWVVPTDSPKITNLFLKKVDSEGFKVSVRIDSFNPYQDYQQAGIILLDKNKTRTHNIRFTFFCCATCTPSQQGLQIIKREHGTAYETYYRLKEWPKGQTNSHKAQTIWLQIVVSKKNFHFFYHGSEEFASFSEIAEINFDFEPRYVAIGAFRGLRDSTKNLNNSEAIPAFFDYVKVEPLPE